MVTTAYGESGTTRLLILSQIVLSLQLSLAVVPLVMFTGDERLRRVFVNQGWIRLAGWATAALIALMNGWLVWQTLS